MEMKTFLVKAGCRLPAEAFRQGPGYMVRDECSLRVIEPETELLLEKSIKGETYPLWGAGLQRQDNPPVFPDRPPLIVMVWIGEIVVAASLGKSRGFISGGYDMRQDDLDCSGSVVQGNRRGGKPSMNELYGIINGSSRDRIAKNFRRGNDSYGIGNNLRAGGTTA